MRKWPWFLSVAALSDDDAAARRGRTLRLLSILGLAGSLIYLVLIYIWPNELVSQAYALAYIPVFVLVRLLLARGHTRAATWIYLIAQYAILIVAQIESRDSMTSAAYAVLQAALVAMGGALLGGSAAAIMAGVMWIGHAVLALLEVRGIFVPTVGPAPVGTLFSELVALGLLVVVLWVSDAQARRALARARQELAEREAAEESLRGSEARWQFALEGAGDGVWDWDIVADRLHLSRQWKAMLGYADDEIGSERREWESRVHPDDLAAAQADVDRHLRGETSSYTNEHRMRHKDGSYIWVLDRGKVVAWGPEGQPLRMIGTHADVTARRQMEEALRLSEAKYRALVSSSSDPIFSFDAQGTYLFVNEAFARRFGKGPEEILGLTPAALLPPEDAQQQLRLVSEVWATAERRSAELTMALPNGERLTYLTVLDPVCDPAGAVASVSCISRDITALKLAESALQESERTLRTLMSNLPGMAYRCLVDRQWTMLFVSDGCYALTGYQPADLLGNARLSYNDLIEPEDQAYIWATIDRAVAERSPFQIQYRIRDAAGTLKWVWEQGRAVYGLEGELLFLEGFITDITDSRLAEDALRESHQELEATLASLRSAQDQLVQQERLAAVGQLAAGIAHDFNNILAVIALYAQLALRAPDLPGRLQERLEVIVGQTRRASDLVQQILDFGRQGVLELKPLDLAPFVHESVELLRRTLPERIRIDFDADAGPLTIHADPTRVQQVLVNLALNARDAMAEGGSLRVRLARVAPGREIECAFCGMITGGDWVEMALSDTGPGIDPEVVPHLFEPFFTTHAPSGHGLGLAQVQGIVRQHGGHIGVETAPGSGTTFRIYWPATALPAMEEREARPGVVAGHGERVLVVEDEPAARGALVEALAMLGYVVLEAADGKRALELLEGSGADVQLVISDWVMPEMDGLALARALEARGSVKLLMVTGHPLTETPLPEPQHTIVGWLRKPVDLAQLAEAVAAALHA